MITEVQKYDNGLSVALWNITESEDELMALLENDAIVAEEAGSGYVVGVVDGYVVVLQDVLCELCIFGIVIFGCEVVFYY